MPEDAPSTRDRMRNARRLALALGAAVALLCAAAVAAALQLSARFDALGREAAERMIRGGLADLEADLRRTSKDYAIWTEAYEAVRGGDRDWAEANLGSGVFDGFIADLMVIAPAGGAAPYGWNAEGATEILLDPPALAAARAALAATPVEDGPTTLFQRSGGALWLIAAIRFTETGGLPAGVAPGDLPVLLIGRRIDDAVLAAVGERFLIDDLALAAEAPEGRDSLPVAGPDGAALGFAAWSPPETGRRLLLAMAPGALAAIALLAALAWLCARRMLSATARIEAALATELAARREKDEFLATVSHELRTPMGGVIGLAQLLLARHRDPSSQELLGALLSTAKSQMQLVSDLLDLARLDGGTRTLAADPFDPAAVLGDVVSLASIEAGRKRVRVTAGGPPRGAVSLRGDALAFRQICGNLIGNAVKFTEAGEVRAEIAAEPAGAGRARLRLTVSDSGPGVPEAARARVFERFAQADAKRDRAKGGHGLGLAVVKSLAEAMGGSIRVGDAPGGGARFTVEIDLAVEPSERLAAA